MQKYKKHKKEGSFKIKFDLLYGSKGSTLNTSTRKKKQEQQKSKKKSEWPPTYTHCVNPRE